MWMGVDLFFILSSFLITGVLLHSRQLGFRSYLGRFYSRRVRRIIIPYLLTLALVSPFIGLDWIRHAWLYLGLTNLLLPLGIAQPYQLSPLWSLAVEEQFYFVWPVAVYFLSRRSLARLAVAMLVLAPVLRGLCHFHEYSPTYMLPWFRMDLLAIGALLALRKKAFSPADAIFGWAMMALGAAALAVETLAGITVVTNTRFTNVVLYESSLLFCLGFMIWALSGRLVGFLKWKPMLFIGTISYTLYLTHMLLLSMHHLVAVEFGLTIAYATASWFLLEKPLLGDRTLAVFLSRALRAATAAPGRSVAAWSQSSNGNQ